MCNLVNGIKGMQELSTFARETVELYHQGKLTDSNIKARKIWLKEMIIQSSDIVLVLTDAAQELERKYNGKTIAEHC